jgi:hypothetical protein
MGDGDGVGDMQNGETKMIRIIEGKRYNTDTATCVCNLSDGKGYSRSNFRFEDTDLYVTPKGTFFLAGEGGPMTRWSRTVGNMSTGGSGIRVIDRAEALAILERENATAEIEKYFDIPDAA